MALIITVSKLFKFYRLLTEEEVEKGMEGNIFRRRFNVNALIHNRESAVRTIYIILILGIT